MLRDVLAYPLRGPNTERVFLPGLVLAFATAILLELPAVLSLTAVLPATALAGVLGEIYADSIDGGTEPPGFDAVRSVLRRGVAVVAIATVYLAPALLAVLITLRGAGGASVAPGSLSFGTSLRILTGATAVFILALVAVYLVPAAIGIAVTTGSIRGGLAVRSVLSAAKDGAYFTGFWIGAFLVKVGIALASALAAFGRPGAALGIAVVFYVSVAAAHVLGRGFLTEGGPYNL